MALILDKFLSSKNMLKTNSTSFVFNSSSPITMFTLPANAVVHQVDVIIDTPFDGSPDLTIGLSGDESKYMTLITEQLASIAETIWSTNPAYIPNVSTENLIATYVAGGATVGAGRIIVYYSNPD